MNRPKDQPDIIPARKDLLINCEPPTRDGNGSAVQSLNFGIAAGPDHIPPESLKIDISLTIDILHRLFTKIWNEGSFQKNWKEDHIVKLLKKGVLKQP